VSRVLILGCGPAGLFAAHAATELGADIEIYSKKRRSEMFGAQYLHEPIPGMTKSDKFHVQYSLLGTIQDYLLKVYGPDLPDNVTVDSLNKIEPAWDIRETYRNAWDTYCSAIVSTPLGIDVAWLQQYLKMNRWPDAVVSTIPAPLLCINREHAFTVRDIWAIGDAPERGIFAPRPLGGANDIWYDGTRDRGWYRASVIAGYAAVEWPEDARPPLEGVSRVAKPIKMTCDCLEEVFGKRLIRIGRYGAWSRFGHSHQAYWTVRDKLKELL
jgi:hypothetical protein